MSSKFAKVAVLFIVLFLFVLTVAYILKVPQQEIYFGFHSGPTQNGKGILIEKVVPDTPAEKAGVKAGDILVEVAGQRIEKMSDIDQAKKSIKLGQQINFKVIRQDEEITLKVIVTPAPPQPMNTYRYTAFFGFLLGLAIHSALAWLILNKKGKLKEELLFLLFNVGCATWHLGMFLIFLSYLLVGMVGTQFLEFTQSISISGAVFTTPLVLHMILSVGYLPVQRKVVTITKKTIFNPLLFLFYMISGTCAFFLISRLIFTHWRWILPYELMISSYFAYYLAFAFASVAVVYFFLLRKGKKELEVAETVERKFAKSMFIAVLIGALGLLSIIILAVLNIFLDYLTLFSQLSSIIPAVVFSYFVLKFNFMDLFIKKSIFYTLLTGIVLVLYVVVIKNTSDWITTYAGVKTGVVEALSIIILVFLLYPLRETIQAGVDKIFFKTKYNYQKTLRDLSRRLTSIVDLEHLLILLVEKITSSLHCKNVSIFLESKNGDFALAKQKGSNFPKDYALPKKDKMIKYLQDRKEPVILKNLEHDKDFVEDSGENRCFLRFKESKIDLIFPMKVKDKMIGTLNLGPKLSEAFYSLEDMDLLSTIADQTAIAIENARLHLESLEKKRLEEELALARQIQQNLLPQSAPQVEGFDIAGINIPSQQVGGDYFDFIEYEDGRLGIAIGDVSGKGVSAALLMSNLQATLKGQVEHDLPIEKTMNIINSLVFRHTASDRFVTFFYGILKLKENSLEYVNAGHNPPILLRGNKEAEFLEEGGLVLGVLPEVEYRKGEIKLQKGDLIVCYTDGITEAINTRDEEFGIEKLIEIMYNNYNVRASEIQERICHEVKNFSSGLPQADDLTMIVIKVGD